MCKVDVGKSLQNKFQPLTFKGETYFEVTYPHRPCTCFFGYQNDSPAAQDSMISGFAKGALIIYLHGHSFSGNLYYITLIKIEFFDFFYEFCNSLYPTVWLQSLKQNSTHSHTFFKWKELCSYIPMCCGVH